MNTVPHVLDLLPVVLPRRISLSVGVSNREIVFFKISVSKNSVLFHSRLSLCPVQSLFNQSPLGPITIEYSSDICTHALSYSYVFVHEFSNKLLIVYLLVFSDDGKSLLILFFAFLSISKKSQNFDKLSVYRKKQSTTIRKKFIQRK